MEKEFEKEIIDNWISKNGGFWIPNFPVKCRCCENYLSYYVMTKHDICIRCFILNIVKICEEELLRSLKNG